MEVQILKDLEKNRVVSKLKARKSFMMKFFLVLDYS